MSLEYAVMMLLCIVSLFVAGLVVGIRGERAAWKLRANGHTAHNADGEFYAVFTERHFLDNYTRKPRPTVRPAEPEPRDA